MKLHDFISILLLLSSSAISQSSPKKITNTPSFTDIKQVYYQQNGQKNGSYTLYYRGQMQAEGAFISDQRTGSWTFYDMNGNICIQGHYRENKKTGEWLYFRDKTLVCRAQYDPDSGKSVFNGFSPDGKLATVRTFDWKSKKIYVRRYYPDGHLKEKIQSQENLNDGLQERFSTAGDTLLIMEFRNGNPYWLKKSSESSSFNEYYLGSLKEGNGKLLINVIDSLSGKFVPFLELNYKNGELNGIYRRYYPSCKLFCLGNFTNGYLNGTFRFYTEEGANDISLRYQLSDSLRNDPKNKIFTEAPDTDAEGNLLPRFQGKSFDTFREHITRNLRYPSEAQENAIQGRVLTTFNINPLGEIEDLKIDKGVHPLLDMEAIRVVRASPLWEPGFRHFIPSTESFTFPIIFVLQ
ncbi:MAG: TonB family protein [Bacteroidales bacterium]